MSEINQPSLFQVQIDAIKTDMHDFKKDIKEHLREVKENSKVQAETVTILRENIVRLTSIAEHQNEKLDAIQQEMKQLKQTTSPSKDQSSLTWYQKLIENKERFFMYVFLILLAVSLGIKVESIVGWLN